MFHVPYEMHEVCFKTPESPPSIRLPTFSNVYLFVLLSMTKHQKDTNLVRYKANWLSEKTVQATYSLPKEYLSDGRRGTRMPCYYTSKT